jgi:hypothetical protein
LKPVNPALAWTGTFAKGRAKPSQSEGAVFGRSTMAVVILEKRPGMTG